MKKILSKKACLVLNGALFSLAALLLSSCKTIAMVESARAEKNEVYWDALASKGIVVDPKVMIGSLVMGNVRRQLDLLRIMRDKKSAPELIDSMEKMMILDIANYWYLGKSSSDKDYACVAYAIYADYTDYSKTFHDPGLDIEWLAPDLKIRYLNSMGELYKINEVFRCRQMNQQGK